MSPDDLPFGWTEVSLRAVTTKLVDGSHNPPAKQEAGVPMLSARNIDRGNVVFDDFRYISREAFAVEDRRTNIRPNDVLLTIVGAIGRAAVVPNVAPFAVQRSVAVLGPQGIIPALLAWQLNAPSAQRWLDKNAKGTAQRGIYLGSLGELSVVVPPLLEQRRIVAKLDALTERSRRAKAALDAIPALIEKFKQSVLAAAFRGDLTADWRAAHPDVEPASELLARIRVERRRRWEEAELAKLTAKGKAPTDDRWKARYEEPEPVDASELPELPRGWAWACLEAATDAARGIPYGIVLTGEHDAGGVPTVRCGDIKNFNVQLAELKRVRSSVAAEFARTALTGGEVLIAIRGTVGATAVAGPEMSGFNISREIAMLPVLRGVDARFVMYALAAPAAQARLYDEVKGVAQSGINLSDLRGLPIAVAPLSEQLVIVQRVEDALKATARVAAAHREGSSSLGRVDQAILAKAFRGELVPQDPSDEPASVLLERIRAERAGADGAASSKPGRRRRAAPA